MTFYACFKLIKKVVISGENSSKQRRTGQRHTDRLMRWTLSHSEERDLTTQPSHCQKEHISNEVLVFVLGYSPNLAEARLTCTTHHWVLYFINRWWLPFSVSGKRWDNTWSRLVEMTDTSQPKHCCLWLLWTTNELEVNISVGIFRDVFCEFVKSQIGAGIQSYSWVTNRNDMILRLCPLWQESSSTVSTFLIVFSRIIVKVKINVINVHEISFNATGPTP